MSLSKIVLFLLVAPVHAYTVEDITVFVSPDSSYPVLLKFMEGASSLYFNSYTFKSMFIAEELVKAAKNGTVIVLLEKNPVGGVPEEQKAVLDKLLKAGIEVYHPQIRFNHAKYVIKDNRSILITTENFGDSGFPPQNSYGNRGWGIVIDDPELTSYFLKIFFEDLEKAERIMEVEPFHFSKTVKKGKYKPKFEERRYIGNFTVIPVVAPVDAVPKILNLLASANRSILIQEFYIYKYWGSKEGYKPNLFLEASIDAARRGCNVKILLDSTWYNVFEDDPVSNLNTLKYINEIAEKEDLPIEARLIDFGKTGLRSLHAKGVIVDEKVVFISSVNWNEHSPTKNREIGVIVYGEPAEYYVEVFFADWNRETRWPIFVALALIFVLCVWKLKPHLRRF